ncbi:helix-turn-helix transcriptional regulator [Streptomyces noursei]|uniref:helix-turn-helix domain-containing protein n=1 Tax=Streptomyces noursei TaxID=1971 RepID=UPI00344B149A
MTQNRDAKAQKRAQPTATRRRVGGQLVRWRESKGLTNDEAAKRARWSPTRVTRTEKGIYATKGEHVRHLCNAWGVDDPEGVDEVAAKADIHPKSGWWLNYADVAGPEYLEFIELEDQATGIFAQHPTIIPGLLQTPAYAREIVANGTVVDTENRVDALVAIRATRQGILARGKNPVRLHALVSEVALHPKLAHDPEIMRDQVRRLISTFDTPNITVQIVPLDTHPGYCSQGPATILEYPHPWVPVVSIDNSLGGNHTDDQKHTSRAKAYFELTSSVALPAEKSRELLKNRLEELHS